MEKDVTFGRMEIYTRECGKTINFTVRESTHLKMGEGMKEIGYREQCTERVTTSGPMVSSIKENITWIWNMDLVAIAGKMANVMRGNGGTTCVMGAAILNIWTVQ